MPQVLIIGSGGAGRDTLWTMLRQNDAVNPGQTRNVPVGFVDDAPGRKGQLIDAIPVVATVEELLTDASFEGLQFHCAIGNNVTREKLCKRLESRGFIAATVVDPSAIIAASATIGEGTFVGAGVVITPHAKIGRHVLINIGSMVGHNTVVGDYAQVCPGARLTGDSRIEKGAFIGANAVIAPSIKIGAYSILGAASLAARDVPENTTAIGVPARVVAPGARTGELS